MGQRLVKGPTVEQLKRCALLFIFLTVTTQVTTFILLWHNEKWISSSGLLEGRCPGWSAFIRLYCFRITGWMLTSDPCFYERTSFSQITGLDENSCSAVEINATECLTSTVCDCVQHVISVSIVSHDLWHYASWVVLQIAVCLASLWGSHHLNIFFLDKDLTPKCAGHEIHGGDIDARGSEDC